MMVLHLQLGLSLYVIPRLASQKLEGLSRLLPRLKGEHLEQAQTNQPTPNFLKDKPLGAHIFG